MSNFKPTKQVLLFLYYHMTLIRQGQIDSFSIEISSVGAIKDMSMLEIKYVSLV